MFLGGNSYLSSLSPHFLSSFTKKTCSFAFMALTPSDGTLTITTLALRFVEAAVRRSRSRRRSLLHRKQNTHTPTTITSSYYHYYQDRQSERDRDRSSFYSDDGSEKSIVPAQTETNTECIRLPNSRALRMGIAVVTIVLQVTRNVY